MTVEEMVCGVIMSGSKCLLICLLLWGNLVTGAENSDDQLLGKRLPGPSSGNQFVGHGEAQIENRQKTFSYKEEIESIVGAISKNSSQDISGIAYQMQCMGDNYLFEKNYDEAAKCYVLALVAVFDNYDLQQFFLHKHIDYEQIPDLSKKVMVDQSGNILDGIIAETALKLGQK